MSADASRPSAEPASMRASSPGLVAWPSSSRRVDSIAAAILRSGNAIAGEAFPLVIGEQSVDDVIEIAVENGFEVAGRETDAVIGQAILREVVRADLLAAVSRADLRAALACRLFFLFAQLRLVEVRAQQLHGALAILELRAFLLACDDGAGRLVRDAHGRLG